MKSIGIDFVTEIIAHLYSNTKRADWSTERHGHTISNPPRSLR